jgi:hypothetical protein
LLLKSLTPIIPKILDFICLEDKIFLAERVTTCSKAAYFAGFSPDRFASRFSHNIEDPVTTPVLTSTVGKALAKKTIIQA